MAARTEFDPTHPAVCEAMHVDTPLPASYALPVLGSGYLFAAQLRNSQRGRDSTVLTAGRGRDIPRQMAFDAAFVRDCTDGNQIPSIDITQQLKKSAEIWKSDVFRGLIFIGRPPAMLRRRRPLWITSLIDRSNA